MTKIKTLKVIALSTIILGSLSMNSAEAFAETEKERASKGQVSFVEDTDPTNPVDPIDPGKEEPGKPLNPIDPNEEIPPGTSGPLSLDFASYFNFGEQKISTKDQSYTAKPQDFESEEGVVEQKPNYVQVTDKRGLQKGWSLNIIQKEQFKGAVTGEELKGAEITFNNAEIVTTSESAKPTTIKNKIVLVPGEQQNVVSANAEEGFGTWVYRFGNLETMADSVRLNIPGSVVKNIDEYNTELTWSLADTPDNSEEQI